MTSPTDETDPTGASPTAASDTVVPEGAPSTGGWGSTALTVVAALLSAAAVGLAWLTGGVGGLLV
ncbi:MAG: hypothetical protein ACO3AV_06320, partial [Ilumatobacteraceae bacterium]